MHVAAVALLVWAASAASPPSPTQATDLVIGIDVGTESARVGVFALDGSLVSQSSASYRTHYPMSGHVEQHAEDWWRSMGEACKHALQDQAIDPRRVKGVTIDTTACSVLFLDATKRPLAPCMLYSDARSADECTDIIRLGRGDPALRVCNDGCGPISAEWMIPKCLWVKRHAPVLWASSAHVCEKNDYLNYLLTGRLVASGCNVAARWNWNAKEATKPDASALSGRPASLLRRLDMSDLLTKWPDKCVPMGQILGTLTAESAAHLGLIQDTPVTQGGPDAYVGMVGLGSVHPGMLAIITGSSHLHLCVGEQPYTHSGVWGAYVDAPLPGLCFVEGGQSATGSVLAWARNLFSGISPNKIDYKTLDTEADNVYVGSAGVLCLEAFQGLRTPVTNPHARGAIIGLSLFHKRAHLWRALLESICFGTRRCMEAMRLAGVGGAEVRITGGATRSDMWLQMHADVLGLPVTAGAFDNAPLLGSAVLAAVGAGLFASVDAAIASMVRLGRRVEPNKTLFKQYSAAYKAYIQLSSAVEPLSKLISSTSYPTVLNSSFESVTESHLDPPIGVQIIPSILAADFSALGDECRMCAAAGVQWLHVDVFDGSLVCTHAFSFGPSSVKAMHLACPSLHLDVHIATANPQSLVHRVISAGASRVTLQYEMFTSFASALELIQLVSAEVSCGLCLAPSTALTPDVIALLSALDATGKRLITSVNVLAVTPGIGGMSFDHGVLSKIKALRDQFGPSLTISVDGGINEETAALCVAAGADELIAGTYLFGTSRSVSASDSTEYFTSKLRELRAVAQNTSPVSSKLSL